jgi:hypothetical protein
MSTIKVNNVIPNTGDTVNINGIIITDGVLSATTYENLPTVEFTGGTVSGNTEFLGGITANTISATTYQNLPITQFTGGTVEGETTFENNVTTNNLFVGVLSATTYQNLPITQFTGGTVEGFTDFTNGLSATSVSATTFYGDGSNLTGINEFYTLTRDEVIDIINSNELIVGATYKITGVDVDLYGGTDIFLQAVTTSELSFNGSGLFFNPKYNETPIWTNRIGFTLNEINGQFNYDEMVITDTNAYGFFRSYGMVELIYGDWSSATTISGLSSLAFATLNDVVAPNYDLGSNVIWGGKKWVNVSGKTITVTDEVLTVSDGSQSFCFGFDHKPIDFDTLIITDGVETFTGDSLGNFTGDLGGSGSISYFEGGGCLSFASPVADGVEIRASYTSTGIGQSLNNYSLNNRWELIPFNDVDYNVVVDEIKYDITNDALIKRKDKFGNEVEGNYITFSRLQNDYDDLGNPIKDFQWGNAVDNWGYDSGLYYFSDYEDNNNGINDGGDDMYDGGNEIYTDLGNVVYTHTRLEDEPDGGVNPILFPKDGQVVSGDTYFGVESEYFTNLYPGLFVLHASNVSVNEFKIDGNIGADDDGVVEADEYVLTGFSTTYKVFVKKVFDSGDPSINHIIIVDTDSADILHEYDDESEDDFDRISNLSGVTKIYYLLTSTFPGSGYITKQKIDEIVNAFVGLVDSKTISEVLTTLNENYLTITNLLPVADTTIYSGVLGNYVKDSYLGCLNFNGGYIWNNELTNFSYISNNYFNAEMYENNNDTGVSRIVNNVLTNNSHIINNYLTNSSAIFNNMLYRNSRIEANRLDGNSDIRRSIISDSSLISYNRFYDNADMSSNNLKHSSAISDNEFINGGFYRNELTYGSSIEQNKQKDSYIQDNRLYDDSTISYNNNGIRVYIEGNELVGGSQINNNSMTGGTINENYLMKSNIIDNIFNNNDFGNNSRIQINNLINSEIRLNNFIDSYGMISENKLHTSSIILNQLAGGSGINFNNLENQARIDTNSLLTQGYIHYNTINNGSRINNGNFGLNARVQYCTLTNSSVFEFANTPQINNGVFYVNSNYGRIDVDITDDTNLYSNYSKNLMSNTVGQSLLVYIDSDNTQQIVTLNS